MTICYFLYTVAKVAAAKLNEQNNYIWNIFLKKKHYSLLYWYKGLQKTSVTIYLGNTKSTPDN